MSPVLARPSSPPSWLPCSVSSWLVVAALAAPAAHAAQEAAAVASPVASLSWSELVARPELWPAQCTLQREMRFQGGQVVAEGATVTVLEVHGDEVVLAAGELTFGTAPSDTDLLAVAQAEVARLSPAQRALTFGELLQRQDLWPYRVTLTAPAVLGTGLELAPGDGVLLVGPEGGDLVVAHEASDTTFLVPPRDTDLLAHARAALAAGGARGRILDELSDKVVDAGTLEPAPFAADERPEYVAVYFSAGWCGPCRQFSPKLVEFHAQRQADRDLFEVVFVGFDRSEADWKEYMADEDFAFRAVRLDQVGELPLVNAHRRGSIPHLLVLDRHGRVLADTFDGDQYVGPDTPLKELGRLLDGARKAKAAVPSAAGERG